MTEDEQRIFVKDNKNLFLRLKKCKEHGKEPKHKWQPVKEMYIAYIGCLQWVRTPVSYGLNYDDKPCYNDLNNKDARLITGSRAKYLEQRQSVDFRLDFKYPREARDIYYDETYIKRYRNRKKHKAAWRALLCELHTVMACA